MSIVKTPTNIDTLKINYLTQEMYDAALENDEINENELYLTPSDGSGGNTNSVELTQAEYDALTTEEKNNGTIYFITDGVPSNLIVNDSVPIGAIQAYGGATAPAGWLMCDGSAVSRSAYSELYVAIGTTFGEGDGSTTFNLPDLRGRTIQGVGTLGTETYTLGDSKDAGLPNITGSFTARSTSYNTSNIIWTDDVLFSSSNAGSTADTVTQANGAQAMKLYTFDASKANAIYGNSTTVQPNTTIANYIIKAKDHSLLQANLLPMLDFFYPVGSYYETSDATYDPNVSMGGTWVLETEGLVHIGAGSNYTVGDTGGSKTVTLSASIGAATGQPATLNYIADTVNGYQSAVGSGSYTIQGSSWTSGQGWSHSTPVTEKDSASRDTNIMQPYIVVNRWHRTA